jgi:ABC-2 type transport system ATP-binding protein
VVAPAPPALEVKGLRKSFAGLVAVDDLSFAVGRGEAVALLGPNGAGKTTAMQLALGLLDREAGEARLFGLDPELLAVRRRVGFAPDAPLFPRALTGLQILKLHGELLGLTRPRAKARAEQVAEQLGFAGPARRPCGGYSRGQSQRLGLAQALLGEPELLLLDEPTAGLDPAGVASLRGLIAELRGRGVAVLLNSHLLSEVERVCDRVLFLKGGRLLCEYSMKEAARRAELRLANAAQAGPRLAGLFPGGELLGDRFRVPVDRDEEMPRLLRRALEEGAEVIEARFCGAELEEMYLTIVEGRT